MVEFDVQSMDLDQLADVASKGGIAALEDLASGKSVLDKTEIPEDAEATNAEVEGTEAEKVPEDPPKEEPEKDHATAVSTKDGKGTIPYSVLKGARERASQFEQENSVLRKQIEELTSRLSAPSTPAETAPETVVEADSRIAEMQAKVDALREEFPELAELYAGQMELLQTTRKQLVDVQSRYEADMQQQRAAAEKQTADTVQETIDANPALSFWQQKAGDEWNAAIELDTLLRSKPEWADKPMDARFARVVEMVKAMNPDAELPPMPTSTEKKQQASSAKRPPVNSLSDIPGGIPPAAGTREQIDEMSVAALGNKFMSMSDDQIREYLSALGG